MHESEDLNSVLLSTFAKQNGSSFIAMSFKAPGQKSTSLFTASVAKGTEGLFALHSTSVLGGARAFSFDEGLTTATVEPDAPFHGAATFQRNADGSTSWTGTLHVFMPGVGDLRLVGPGYEAKLEHPKVTSGQGIAIFNGGFDR